jgi:uncharacterized protein (DUF305 family)
MDDTDHPSDDTHEQSDGGAYLRFFAMIATAMAAMYALTYANSMELAHVRWSETRVYMTLVMGASMGLIMLGFMLGHYRSRTLNVAVVLISLFSGVLGLYLVRSQTTVQDGSFMKAMIPHHSIAILTSERSETRDVRVCELQVAIIEAQRREIAEMSWLIDDIERNGPAESVEEARERPVPDFEGTSSRRCPPD